MTGPKCGQPDSWIVGIRQQSAITRQMVGQPTPPRVNNHEAEHNLSLLGHPSPEDIKFCLFVFYVSFSPTFLWA
jgi:hypothetical protein